VGQSRGSYGGALAVEALQRLRVVVMWEKGSVGITNAKEKKITGKCICQSDSNQCAGTNAVIGQRATWGFMPRFLRAPLRPVAG
jgi:hypothetical protein